MEKRAALARLIVDDHDSVMNMTNEVVNGKLTYSRGMGCKGTCDLVLAHLDPIN